MRNQNETMLHKRLEYNLENPEQRELIRQFESEFEASGFKGPGSFNFWLRHIGIIRFQKQDWKNYAIKDITRYSECQQKWGALQELRRRRTFEQLQQMTGEERMTWDKEYSLKQEREKVSTTLITQPVEIISEDVELELEITGDIPF